MTLKIPQITKNPRNTARSSWLPIGVKPGFLINSRNWGRLMFFKGWKNKKIVINDKTIGPRWEILDGR